MQKLSYLTNAMADKNDGLLEYQMMKGVYDRMSSQLFNSGAIAVGTTTTKVNLAAAVNGVAGGQCVSKAITADFWDTTTQYNGFVIAAGQTNVCCLWMDAAGNSSVSFGTSGANGTAGFLNGAVKFPPMKEKLILCGFAVISAVATSWTAGTSNFSTSGGNYTVTLINSVGMFDPTATI